MWLRLLLDGIGEMLSDNMELEVILNPDEEAWKDFNHNQSQGNVYQTPEMVEVYRRTKNHDPVYLAIVDNNGEFRALMVAVIIKEMEGLIGSLSARSIIIGGPLFIEDEDTTEVLLKLFEEYNKIQKGVLYSEIRNIYDTSRFREVLARRGYEFKEHLNYLIDLNKSKEELWGQISRSMRKNINRAERAGLEIEEMKDRDRIPVFYGFLEDVYRHAKMPLADISLFYAVYDILVPKGMAKFHLAKYDGEYVGGRLSLMDNKTIYADFVGVPKEHKKLNVNPLLNWNIIKWGSENGYQVFDFGGAGKPGIEYGVREFKRQFGGELVNFGRYNKVHSPIKMSIAEKGFKIYKKMLI